MPDILTTMIDELRADRPSGGADLEAWLARVAELVQAMPTRERRWACVIVIANDIVMDHPERCLRDTFWVIAWALLETDEVEEMQAEREAGHRTRPEWVELLGNE